jgi:hypothetical protein
MYKEIQFVTTSFRCPDDGSCSVKTAFQKLHAFDDEQYKACMCNINIWIFVIIHEPSPLKNDSPKIRAYKIVSPRVPIVTGSLLPIINYHSLIIRHAPSPYISPIHYGIWITWLEAKRQYYSRRVLVTLAWEEGCGSIPLFNFSKMPVDRRERKGRGGGGRGVSRL